MQELAGTARLAARPLIERLPSPIYALSIVDGRSDGRVFVDDAAHPEVAVTWETTGNLFISGAPSAAAVQALGRLLETEFIPEALRTRSRPMCFIAYTPEAWGDRIPSMLRGRPPIPDGRLCYRSNAPADVAIPHLAQLARSPEGCEVMRVDRALLDSALANVDEVRAEARKMWGTLDRFLAEGFGYCVVAEDAVTAWSLNECPAGDSCSSVGVETIESFRRRGHGAAAAASTLKRCYELGIKANWDLYATNEGSLKLAEKLGLARVAAYPIRFFWFNKVDNLLVNARVAWRRLNRLPDALDWFEQAFQAAETSGEAESSWLFSDPSDRADWYRAAAKACTEAGRLDKGAEYSAKAASEEKSTSTEG